MNAQWHGIIAGGFFGLALLLGHDFGALAALPFAVLSAGFLTALVVGERERQA